MATSKLKLWLPVVCFAAYVTAPLDRWTRLITTSLTEVNLNNCPGAEKYITDLAFLIFYLAFVNALLLALVTWINLLLRHMVLNVIVEIVTIGVIFFHSSPAIYHLISSNGKTTGGRDCLDKFVAQSSHVHLYLVVGYVAALFIRILLWRHTVRNKFR